MKRGTAATALLALVAFAVLCWFTVPHVAGWLVEMHTMRERNPPMANHLPGVRSPPPCSRNSWRGVPACED